MTTEIADAEIVETPGQHEPERATVATPGAALEIRPPSREVLMPLDAEQVVAGMAAYQELLPRLLTPADYQDAGRGKRFVKKSGLRKISRAFNLSTLIVACEIERDADGAPQRASAIVRAVAPNGQACDGDGYCDAAEERFSGPRGNRTKLEHDLRASATTRAKSRAIADLIGMGDAEDGDTLPGELPAWTRPASSDADKTARRRLGALIDDQTGEHAAELYTAIRSSCQLERLPVVVADLLEALHAARGGGDPTT